MLSRLRKIAHMMRIFDVPGTAQASVGIVRNTPSQGVHLGPRILKLLPTLKADLVRPFLDGEYTAQLAVLTPEGKLENCRQ